MAILLDNNSRVLCQGITGQAGSFHTRLCREYGTPVVAGVTPGKGGSNFESVPIYDTVKSAGKVQKANVSMIFVPAAFASDAAIEAIEAGIQLIIVITEGIPVHDMLRAKNHLTRWNERRPSDEQARIIGPNCPGVITPDVCKVGIMPGSIHTKGPIGVVSRSGTLTYEAVWQLTQLNLGQSTVVGIGGDPIPGSNFVDILTLFEKDSKTKAVVLLGEIGGRAEEDAADYFKNHMSKPVYAFVAGQTAPPGKKMGHAGAIIEGGSGKAADKIAYLKDHGVIVAESPADIGATVKKHFVPQAQ